MANQGSDPGAEPKVFRTLREDIGRSDFASSVQREFREAKDFMLDEQRKMRLGEMGLLKRWFYTGWWMLKSMFFKLTPARRILLTAGVVLILLSRSVGYTDDHVRVDMDINPLGVLCILFVLMLELKDKLLVREELEAGRTVQVALMPEKSPSVPGWQLWLFTRPANEVGGDLVDFIRVDDARCGVVVGDVAGKGLRAALLMAKLQATLRALVADYASLSQLVSKLNQIFCRDSLRNIFASMVYIELHPGSGLIHLVNAGHLPLIVVRGAKVERLPKGGAALGITSEAVFVQETLEIGPQDFLCAYSDGITEAQNSAGEFLGEQRFIDFLSRQAGRTMEEIGDGLVAEVDRFIGTAGARDDLSVALIRRLP